MAEETGNFWEEILKESEFDVIPNKLQRFLHRDSPPAIWTQTMGFYAHGYNSAFERLVMIAIDVFSPLTIAERVRQSKGRRVQRRTK